MVVRVSVNNHLLQVSLKQGGENCEIGEIGRRPRLRIWCREDVKVRVLYLAQCGGGETVDALDSKPSEETRVGSNPTRCTKF